MTIWILNTQLLSYLKKNHLRGKWAKDFLKKQEAAQVVYGSVKGYSACNQKNKKKEKCR